MQELVEIVGRSTGIALMAPPADSDAAQQTLNTLLSAVNKKQKVRLQALLQVPCLACVLMSAYFGAHPASDNSYTRGQSWSRCQPFADVFCSLPLCYKNALLVLLHY